jgi:hypothetical protein
MQVETKKQDFPKVPPVNLDEIRAAQASGNLDEALKRAQLYEFLKRQEKELEKDTERARTEESKLLAIQEEIERRTAYQDECPHLKENNKSAIGGIRDSRNNTHWICMHCQKLWKNEELPMYLRNGVMDVGGPTFG